MLVRIRECRMDLGQTEPYGEEIPDLIGTVAFLICNGDVNHADSRVVDAGGTTTHPRICGDVRIGGLRNVRDGHRIAHSTVRRVSHTTAPGFHGVGLEYDVPTCALERGRAGA